MTGIKEFIVSQYLHVLVGTSLHYIDDMLDHDSV